MLGSKSKFFLQDDYALEMFRDSAHKLLLIKNRKKEEIETYLKSYDFFCKYPTKFDGATIVKDLHDIPNLDLDAMVHDYECLIGANRDYKLWYISAWNYYENMRKNGKGNQFLRFAGLCLAGVFFVPYCKLLKPKYNK